MGYPKLKEFVGTMPIGSFFLDRIRKVRNTAYPERYKVQLQGWERVVNDSRKDNLLKILNEGDSRFEAKPIPAWIVAEPEVIISILDNGIKMSDLEKLEIFSGEEFPLEIQQQGKHFHWLGYENPLLDGIPFHVQVNEFTSENEIKNKRPKIVPTTGQIITFNGIPVYRETTIVTAVSVRNNFLESDGATSTKRLSLAIAKKDYQPDEVTAELRS